MRALPLAWLVGIMGCAAKPSSGAAPTVPADSATAEAVRLPGNGAPGTGPSAASSAPPVPVPVPGIGRPQAWAHFELVPREGGVRALVAIVSKLGVEREVALVPPEHRCAAEGGPTGDRAGAVKVGCGLEVVAEMSPRGDDGVHLVRTKTGEELPLPVLAGVSLWISPLLHEPATPSGCADAKPTPRAIPALATVRPGGNPYRADGSSLFLVIPSLGVDLRMGPAGGAYCHASYSERTRRYEARCREIDYYPEFDAYFEGDGLLFRYVDRSVDTQETVPLGGFRVPCGTRVRFPSIHRVDPGFRGFHSPCREKCGQVDDLCRDKCERHAPSADALGECQTKCSEARERCWWKTCGP